MMLIELMNIQFSMEFIHTNEIHIEVYIFEMVSCRIDRKPKLVQYIQLTHS